MMAAPFDREPGPGKGAGGNVLALWAERTGRRQAACARVAVVCGSRFTGGCRRRTGRIG